MIQAHSQKALLKSLRLLNSQSRAFATTTFKVRNPYTHEPYCECTYKTAAEMQAIIKETYQEHKKWKRTPLEERIKVVEKAAEYFSQNQDTIAKDITGQMGKPITQAVEELKGLQNVFKKLIGIAPQALADKVVKENQQGLLKYTREATGVSAIFSPWNFPALTCGNLVITSALAGNGVVIKHSPHTPLLGKHFEESFKYAGAEHIVRDLMITADDAKKLYNVPEISFLGFTGSTETGRNVQNDLTTDRIVDYTLELGGNDAAYIAEDADLNYAAKEIVRASMYNAGQACNGIARVYVHSSLYDDFLNIATHLVMEYKLGDPMNPETTMGPLAQPDQPESLQKAVEDAVAQGARVIIGGMPTNDSDGKGTFFEPTIVADGQNDMNLMLVENFGPVMCVAPTEGDDEVIKLINDDQYGLTAAIFSRNQERIMNVASRLHVGTVYGNRALHIDPSLPWSGRKNSGIGASLSELGFHAVTNPKSYNIKFINS